MIAKSSERAAAPYVGANKETAESSDNWAAYAVSVAVKPNMKFHGFNHRFDADKLSAIQGKDRVILGADATHHSRGSAKGVLSATAVVRPVDGDYFLHYGSMMMRQPMEEKEAGEVSQSVRRLLLETLQLTH